MAHHDPEVYDKIDYLETPMRELIPYGIHIENGVEMLFNRDYVIIDERPALSEAMGWFYNDSCSPWRGYGQPKKDCEAARLRSEGAMLAWVLEKPLDPYIFSGRSEVNGDYESSEAFTKWETQLPW